MGNYMDTCLERRKTEEEEEKPQEEKQDCGKRGGTYGKESSTMRVKLVLTKDELEWMLLELKKKEGRRLEEVLMEIEKSRLQGKSVAVWKPSLQSIPEVLHEMDRSSS